MNLIFKSDSYKSSHFPQYPAGTNGMFSHIEARAGEETVVFGLQPILEGLLAKTVSRHDVEEAADFFIRHGLPFNYDGWMRVVNRHGGHIPIRVRAVREGTVVPTKNVLVTVEPTDPELPWMGSYFEAPILRMWYPTTVATRSFEAKKVIRDALLRTANDLSGLPFKLHDFGARGVSSGESAELGGMAHLANFVGSDTVEAVVAAARAYGSSHAGGLPMFGYSIPAAEHSTITSWGRENEVEAYRNMIRQFGRPGKLFAVVSDSYDIYNACEHLWGEVLRQEVIDSGATLVVRPDSGEPAAMVLRVHEMLGAKFGYSLNSKGFKVLNNVRVIQGDGLNGPGDILNILLTLESYGWSADNVAFGMGGGLLQRCNRDDFSFAMKCSAIKVGDEWRDVYKDPITASNKKSKKGRLTLLRHGSEFVTCTEEEARTRGWEDTTLEALQTVYENGEFRNRITMDEVRANTGLW